MAGRSFLLTDELHGYLVAHTASADEVEQSLIQETRALGDPAGMQISLDQARFMGALTRAVSAAQALEVGVFTGMSALAVARALPPDGRLVACDTSEEWTAIARRHWEQAGVADRVDLRIGPALDTLRSLPAGEQFDIAFVDAEKAEYVEYWEEIVPRVRSGGVVLADNVLWSGRVVDPGEADEGTKAIRRFNDHVAADGRVDAVILPLGDGVTFAVRR